MRVFPRNGVSKEIALPRFSNLADWETGIHFFAIFPTKALGPIPEPNARDVMINSNRLNHVNGMRIVRRSESRV